MGKNPQKSPCFNFKDCNNIQITPEHIEKSRIISYNTTYLHKGGQTRMKNDNEERLSKIGDTYYKHRKLLVGVASEYLHTKEASEDAVHNAVEKIIKYGHNIDFDDEARTRNYFVRVVRNVAIDLCNKHNANQNTSLDTDPLINLTASENTNPEQYAISNETVNIIINEIENMNPQYSDVLKCLKQDHMTIVETSQLLNISKRTVSYRMETARNILKEKLRKAGR